MAAPGELRDVELEVLGWRTEDGETALICRLLDGSSGTIPRAGATFPGGSRRSCRSTLSARRRPGGCCWLAPSRCGAVRAGVEPPPKTEANMPGQLALATSEEAVVPAAVWETLPPEVQIEVTIRLARLLAQTVEAERDE